MNFILAENLACLNLRYLLEIFGTKFNVIDKDSEDGVGVKFESDKFDIGGEYVDRFERLRFVSLNLNKL